MKKGKMTDFFEKKNKFQIDPRADLTGAAAAAAAAMSSGPITRSRAHEQLSVSGNFANFAFGKIFFPSSVPPVFIDGSFSRLSSSYISHPPYPSINIESLFYWFVSNVSYCVRFEKKIRRVSVQGITIETNYLEFVSEVWQQRYDGRTACTERSFYNMDGTIFIKLHTFHSSIESCAVIDCGKSTLYMSSFCNRPEISSNF